MGKIRLEFEELTIHRPKKRWKLYFVIVAQHPDDPDKMVITSVPEPFIRVKPAMNNVISFEPEGVGTDGLFILKREMPADRRLNVQVYLRHTRQSTRNLGSFLQNMESELGGDVFGIVTDILGTTNPWLVIAKKAVPMIGSALRKIKDRDMGFVSMFEEFGPEFENEVELDRSNKFSTGNATIVWSWSIDEDS